LPKSSVLNLEKAKTPLSLQPLNGKAEMQERVARVQSRNWEVDQGIEKRLKNFGYFLEN